MTEFSAINLSELVPPDVVEPLDYEGILSRMRQELTEKLPDFSAELLESDPAIKLLEVAAYHELLLRQRVNDAARAVMLATAKGNDLDHLGAAFGVARQVVDSGDPDAIPPIAETLEDDDRFRERIQLAPEEQINQTVTAYVSKQHRLGEPVTIAGLHASLFICGVTKAVNLITPTTDILPQNHQAAYCNNIAITHAE